MATSFAPRDFGTGKWQGGPATLTNPRFEYRSFTPKVGKNAGSEVKNVTFYAEYVDPEGNPHKAQYDVGNAEFCQIKESADEGADEAESGPSFGSPDPTRTYKVYADSDFAKFTQSLMLSGYSEAELQKGDVSVLDGLEVEVENKPRNEKDTFGIYIIKAVKQKAGAKRTAGAAAKSGNGKAASDASDVALAFVAETLAAAGGPVTQSNLVKNAMAKFKGQDIKADVVGLISKASFLQNADSFIYDAEDKTVTAL